MQFDKEGMEDTDILENAGDDGHDALKIAEDTGYIWAKLDALNLLAAYHNTKAALPDTDTQTENEHAQSYLAEAKSLQDKLTLSEAQMQELKKAAEKEFLKQTAGWDK